MRILVVEDDLIIGDGLLIALQLEGYAVDWTEDKESARLAMDTHKYDMLLLDIGLPDGSGLDLLAEVRGEKNNVPIIILTAFDRTSHKIQGLDAGADDYIVKPFKLKELQARIRSLHRRRNGRIQTLLRENNIELNPATYAVSLGGKTVKLGPKEFSILRILMENPNVILSKQQIEDALYGWGTEIESNTIEVHIYKLRKKIGKNAITTFKNQGYRLAPVS